ncbi:PfaD family polyunsaturated fatty acid/polyketide biosynthesis protein [Amycolatopsis japonica]
MTATDLTRSAVFDEAGLVEAVRAVREPVHIIRERHSGRIGLGVGATGFPAGTDLLGISPPSYPEWLGDRAFVEDHGARFPYVAGEMANGIASTRFVRSLAEKGMLAFFGAGGLAPDAVGTAVSELVSTLGNRRHWGVNLIHTPDDPAAEDRLATLLITRDVPIVSASAFMAITPAVVRCAVAGLGVDPAGRIIRRRKLFAKVSRPEVAEQFMSPAPQPILDHLVSAGQLTETEARLASHIPLAQDVTAEGDSGGHTDGRPLGVLLPALLTLRDTLARRLDIAPVRVGAAGGLGTPQSVAGAFASGAAYVVTGTINQTAVEANLSEDAKTLLAKADFADVCMAPAPDMFELGIKLQVLRKGSLFAGRAAQLYETYRSYASLHEIPDERRKTLERTVLGESFDSAWAATRSYWLDRDAEQVTKAESDPRHLMALVFRSYLGRTSKWAITGEPTRRNDYQIWCGPVIGAFNRWIDGGFLAVPENRTAAQIGLNLLEGAAAVSRAQQFRGFGLALPSAAFSFTPRRLA